MSRCPGLTVTPSYNSAVSSALVGSCKRSLAEGVEVDWRATSLQLGSGRAVLLSHLTPATNLAAGSVFALSFPLLLFPLDGLAMLPYPTRL